MTSSFVFWPVTCSFKSANIYARSFLQDALLFRSKSHVFFPVCFVVLNFAVVKRYICCALTLQNAAIVCFVSEAKADTLGLAWFAFKLDRGAGVRARAAVKPSPSACWVEDDDDRVEVDASAGPADGHGRLTSAKTTCH